MCSTEFTAYIKAYHGEQPKDINVMYPVDAAELTSR